MTPETVMEVARQAMIMLLLISAPLMLAALVTGLLVSVFQAATQINETTLSFVPKLVVVFGTLLLAGPWMLDLLVNYLRQMITSIPGLIG